MAPTPGKFLPNQNPQTDRLWGWSFKENTPKQFKNIGQAVIAPNNNDGAYVIDAGFTGIGGYNYTYDFLGGVRSENGFIQRYRDISVFPEVDKAIRDIVDEAIVIDDNGRVEIKLNMDELKVGDKVKNKLADEFKAILNLLDFQNQGSDLFRSWYVDGKLYVYLVIDSNNSGEGIQELRVIDPMAIKKVREEIKSTGPGGIVTTIGYREYYTFNSGYVPANIRGFGMAQAPGQEIQIAPDSVVMVPSGVWDPTRSFMIGSLHKAIRAANQLRMMEDATVIYRMVRAPERRAFYIETGNLPKNKAEQYIRSLINKYRNRVSYDASTGTITEKGTNISMLEDFWLPRNSNGKGTEIQTLQGGTNLGEIADVDYFKKNLYMALNVPRSRVKEDATFGFGKNSEISRDEISYARYIAGLRRKFSSLLLQLLERQVLLKGIMTRDEWEEYVPGIIVIFPYDNYFAEIKEIEVLKNRVEALNSIKEGIGLYFSTEWVRKNVLRQTDEEITQMKDEIAKERKEGLLDPSNVPFDSDLAKSAIDSARLGIDSDKVQAEIEKMAHEQKTAELEKEVDGFLAKDKPAAKP